MYAAQSSTEPVVTNCSAHNVIIVPLPGAELAAFEAVMVELARLRLHGAAEVRPPGLLLFVCGLCLHYYLPVRPLWDCELLGQKSVLGSFDAGHAEGAGAGKGELSC